jgi:hypothetical protein
MENLKKCGGGGGMVLNQNFPHLITQLSGEKSLDVARNLVLKQVYESKTGM